MRLSALLDRDHNRSEARFVVSRRTASIEADLAGALSNFVFGEPADEIITRFGGLQLTNHLFPAVLAYSIAMSQGHIESPFVFCFARYSSPTISATTAFVRQSPAMN